MTEQHVEHEEKRGETELPRIKSKADSNLFFKCDLFVCLPASVELDVGIEEADDGTSGGIPPVDPSSDQTLSLAVSDDLHQARVALVHVLVKVELELH